MDVTMALFLLRYAEMGLKSEKVRGRFQRSLVENIENHFVKLNTECLVSWDRGRIFVMTDNTDSARKVFSHTFGIVSYSEATEAEVELEPLLRSVVSYASGRLARGKSFAIRARRSGQQKYTSMELARKAGEAILDGFAELGLTVDLEEPDVEIFVEAREKGAYIYSEMETGPGGLPLGTQGTVLCHVVRREDILAAWLMMRRGCSVIIATGNRESASPLVAWDPEIKFVEAHPGTDLHALARQNGCKGISFATEYSDIASTAEPKDGLALFYPLTGLIQDERKRLLDKVL